jgi:hypothetical protein
MASAVSAIFPAGGGFLIDGVQSDAWRAYIRGYQIGLLPSIRSKLTSIPGVTGKFNPGQELDSRLLTVDMTIAAPAGRAQAFGFMRSLAMALDPRVGLHALEFEDNPGWYLNCTHNQDPYVTGLIVDSVTGLALQQFTLSLEAGDAYWWSDTVAAVAWPVAPGAAGGTLTVVNSGLDSTPLTITIRYPTGQTLPLGGILIGGFPNGASIGYAGSITAGGTIVINTATMSITNNGVSDIANWSGQMPYLPPGMSTLTFADANHVGMSGSVSWQARSL